MLPGIRGKADLEEVLKFNEATEEEKDYSIISKFTPLDATGKCVYCNHCKPCHIGLDIGLINIMDKRDTPFCPSFWIFRSVPFVQALKCKNPNRYRATIYTEIPITIFINLYFIFYITSTIIKSSAGEFCSYIHYFISTRTIT